MANEPDPTPEEAGEATDAVEETDGPTISDKQSAERIARMCELRCKQINKHRKSGTCLECMTQELILHETRRRERREEELRLDLKRKLRWGAEDKEQADEQADEQEKLKKKIIPIVRVGCAAVIAAIVGWWVFGSWMEASTYAKLTGKDVSTWDAMWVEFRVQGEAKD